MSPVRIMASAPGATLESVPSCMQLSATERHASASQPSPDARNFAMSSASDSGAEASPRAAVTSDVTTVPSMALIEFALPDDPRGPAQFKALMDAKTAKWDALGLPHKPADGGQEFRCIRLPFHEGAVSFTMDGGPACRKLLADFTEADLGSVRMFRAPNNWNHFLSDHIIHFRVLPLGQDRTTVRTTWLVHEDAVEGVDYDIERLTEVWIATNAQDAELAEVNHRGIRSMAYRPGPYAPSEFMLTNFANWYAGKMADFVAGPTPVRMAAE